MTKASPQRRHTSAPTTNLNHEVRGEGGSEVRYYGPHDSAFIRNDAVENEVRPHPSPLPQERENHLSGLERLAVSEPLKDIQKARPLPGGEGLG